MTKCKNEGCPNDVREGYVYCADCYAKWKNRQSIVPSQKQERWDDDKLIDVLLKINSNLGNINKSLQEIANRIRE